MRFACYPNETLCCAFRFGALCAFLCRGQQNNSLQQQLKQLERSLGSESRRDAA